MCNNIYDHIPLALHGIVSVIAIKEGITADVANRLSINGRTAAVPPVRNTAIYLANI